MTHQRSSAALPPPASGYFTDSKKGEVNELKEVCLWCSVFVSVLRCSISLLTQELEVQTIQSASLCC